MTDPVVNEENKVTDTENNAQLQKELNFRRQEMMYERKLAEKERELEELRRSYQSPQNHTHVEDDDDDEPYVDKRKLKKHLERFGEQNKQYTQSEIQRAVNQALEEKDKNDWMKNNSDFYDVINKHAEEFANRDPELAESILKMPPSFAREKLVYRTIKAMGLDKPKQPISNTQQRIDQNRMNPVQPTNFGNSPYVSQSDFSRGGQKQAYEKMQELKQRLGLN